MPNQTESTHTVAQRDTLARQLGSTWRIDPRMGRLLASAEVGMGWLQSLAETALTIADERVEGNDRMHRVLQQAKDRQLLHLEQRLAAVEALAIDFDGFGGDYPDAARRLRAVSTSPASEPTCACVGYTIRTDYGTGIEHDVDRSSCPIHEGDDDA